MKGLAFQFAGSFVITMLYPFLPFMVKFLIPELEDDDKAVGKLSTEVVCGGM